MSNEIKNSKKEIKEGIEMNDCDYLNSVLTLEKNMSNDYSIALNEASNDYLYEDFFTLLEDSKDISREIYNLLFKNGWYILEKVEEDKINKTIKKLEKELKEVSE